MTTLFARRLPGICIACLCLLAIGGTAAAQDTHYWNLQYGTRGELLGGVVVGSAVDMSATYYNPGSLSLVKDPSFILTASVFQIQTIRLSDSGSEASALASRTVGPAPNLIAGLLPLHWFGDKWAYSFLTRQQLDFRLDSRDGVLVGLDDPGDTLSIGGEIILDQNLTENWGGATWSTRWGSRFGLGASLYGAYRSQRTRTEQTIEAIGNNDYGTMLTYVNEVDYQTFRMLTKLGISADFAGNTFGVTVTTRGLQIFGSGEVIANQSVIGDVDGNGTDDSAANVSFGKDLSAEYHSPLSVAIGGSRPLGSSTIHATVEWFSSVDEYTVVQSPAPAAGPGVTTFDMTYAHGLSDVWNFGFGLEKQFSERTTAYASFITDHSAWKDLDNRPIVLTSWDLYQINGGVAFAIKGVDLTLGGGLTWGSRPIEITPVSLGVLPATASPTDMTYRRLKMLIGFAL
jgi:hypothetical protein